MKRWSDDCLDVRPMVMLVKAYVRTLLEMALWFDIRFNRIEQVQKMFIKYLGYFT